MNNIGIENLYKTRYNKFVKKIGGRIGSRHNAEDVVQEAFCRALKYKDAFNPEHKELGAWFNTILNNCLKDFKREERNGKPMQEYKEEEIVGHSQPTDNQNLIDKLEEEIGAKEGKTRDVLFLYFIRQYRPKDIRHIIDMKVKCIKTIAWRFKVEMNGKYGELFNT